MIGNNSSENDLYIEKYKKNIIDNNFEREENKGMTQREAVIHVYSVLNPFIDFMISLKSDEDMDRAEEIINSAYNKWFDLENNTVLQSTPICEYICDCLDEGEIQYSLYYISPTEDKE